MTSGAVVAVLSETPAAPVMVAPAAITTVEAALIVKLTPGWKLTMTAPAGTFVPETGMPTYQPAVLPV